MATLQNETEGESLRDALDAAYQQHATDEPDTASHGDAAAPAPAAGGDGAAAPPAGQAPAAAAPAGAQERPRDPHGRFAPKDARGADQAQAQAAPVPADAAAGAAQPTQAPSPGGELKPPASWKPQAREKWASVDPEVRAEVHRREWEMQHLMQESAQARQLAQQFERAVQPYSMFIAQENSTPLQAVQNLMQTAASLRIGTPQTKAQLVASIIQTHNVDVAMLDTMLAGRVPVQGQQQEFRDPRFDQFLAQQQQLMQRQEQQAAAEAAQKLQTFGDTHEFYGDVVGDMADLVERCARRGEPVDLEKIYARACQMHEGVSTILAQRAAAKTNASSSAAVLRAKRAAASVKGDTTPADGATVPRDDSVRAAIEAAIESAGRA